MTVRAVSAGSAVDRNTCATGTPDVETRQLRYEDERPGRQCSAFSEIEAGQRVEG